MTRNRLGDEASLYLQQHATNPVHWQPWGDEAFALARELDRPLIISIGYASCHWCHVMERESFGDPTVAAFQNEHFVSVKVDREERPDIDHVYMAACQVIHRSGGWPLNAFVLPDGRPFYAGTYYPPEATEGRPSWRELLEHMATAWAERRQELHDGADELMEVLQRHEQPQAAGSPMGDDRLRTMAGFVKRRADEVNGGFGLAPKFPSVPLIELCARLAVRLDDDELHDHEGRTLDAMAAGGLYDQVGGGFARYSTDAHWRVPHFEKMLFDNALLLRAYADACLRRVMPPRRWQEVLRETMEWLEREMAGPDGLLHATLDADSGGEEGAFYVWTPDEFNALFGRRTQPFRDFFGVSKRGNFGQTGTTVLSRAGDLPSLARALRMTTADAREALTEARQTLLDARSERSRPVRDDKHVTAWNAWAIQGIARAGLALTDAAVVERAATLARALLRYAGEPSERARVRAARPDGSEHVVPAQLEDYASVCLALLDLGLASGEHAWLEAGADVAQELVDRAWRADDSRFVSGAEQLVVESVPAQDNATPSPSAMASLALARYAALLPDDDRAPAWARVASQATTAHLGELERAPLSASTWLRAWEVVQRGVTVLVAVVPPEADVDAWSVRCEAAQHVEQDDAFFVHRQGDPVPNELEPWLASRAPIRGADDKPVVTWYACRGRQCGLPAATAHRALAGL